MNSFIKRSSVFLLLLCSGCGHQPERATISSPLSMDRTSELVMNSSQFTSGEWPSREWWEIFNDAQLSHLIHTAIQNNPGLKKVEAKLLFAEQEAKKVRASLFPHVGADYAENWQYFSKNGFVRDFYPVPSGITLPSSVNQIDLTLSFFYEFDFWGKNRKMYRAALGLAKAELAERIQAELSISTLVAFAYFELQTHREQLRLYQDSLHSWEKTSTLINEQNAAGVAGTISVLDASREIFLARQNVSEAEKNCQIDQYVLKALLAKSPDENLEITASPATFAGQIPLPENLGADLLARRADLMAMIWRAEAASEEIGVAKTDFYPNINLTALAGVESLQFPTLFSWSSRTGALQPAIHLPIFTAGKLKANLSSKIAKFNEAVQSYNEGLLEATKEVATELSTLYSLYERLEMQSSIIDTRSQKQLLSHMRFTSGIDNYERFLGAHQELISEELSKVTLENYRLLSIVRLIKSLGGGYHREETPSIIGGR
ncbi:MAG: efflux transporter outer membrane subunit [Chlamydiae bacterium]|nr:efflux transporter outer membrane subunit [Chlamydiota bacterium]